MNEDRILKSVSQEIRILVSNTASNRLTCAPMRPKVSVCKIGIGIEAYGSLKTNS